MPQLEKLPSGALAHPPLSFMSEERAQVKKVTFEERDSLNSSEGGNSFDTVIHTDIGAEVALVQQEEDGVEDVEKLERVEDLEEDPFQNGSSLIWCKKQYKFYFLLEISI